MQQMGLPSAEVLESMLVLPSDEMSEMEWAVVRESGEQLELLLGLR